MQSAAAMGERAALLVGLAAALAELERVVECLQLGQVLAPHAKPAPPAEAEAAPDGRAGGGGAEAAPDGAGRCAVRGRAGGAGRSRGHSWAGHGWGGPLEPLDYLETSDHYSCTCTAVAAFDKDQFTTAVAAFDKELKNRSKELQRLTRGLEYL